MNCIPRYVYVNPLIFLLIFYSWVIDKTQELFILYFIITVHELSHILSARFFSIKTEKILITPIGIAAKIDTSHVKSVLHQIIISGAGPMSNLIMGLVGVLVNSYFLDNSNNMSFFILANFSLALLNLLPVLPLDGGRIFKYILLSNLGIGTTIKIFSVMTWMISISMIALGIIQLFNYSYNLSLLFIGGFLYIIMYREKREMQFLLMKEIVSKKEKANGIEYLIKFEGRKAIEVIKDFYINKYNVIGVIDGDMNLMGQITEIELINCLVENNINLTLKEVLEWCRLGKIKDAALQIQNNHCNKE